MTTSKRSSFARHDVVNTVARGADQCLDLGAANGEKADQMLGGWQHGDVLDTFVIGLAGAVGGVGYRAVCGHGVAPNWQGFSQKNA
ncbi:MAG: hypothetical protein RIR45_1726 [Pseudomonadota bacterium]